LPFGILFVCCPGLFLTFSCGSQSDIEGDPSDLIARGWEYLTIQEFDRSADQFRSALRRSDPEGRECALALYGLGCVGQFRRPEPDLETARRNFQRAVDEDRTGEIAPWAALALARSEFVYRASRDLTEELMTDDALRQTYRDVIRDYPGTDAAQEAALHLAQSLFASEDDGEAEEAVSLLEGLLEADADSPYRYAIYGTLSGYAYRHEQFFDQYKYMVRQLEASTDPDRYRGDFYYRIAYQADARLNRPDLAIPYYERMLDECRIDARSYQVRRAVERLRAATDASTEAGSAMHVREGGE
jgi:tetratricopeptide (TPR) repeat protein